MHVIYQRRVVETTSAAAPNNIHLKNNPFYASFVSFYISQHFILPLWLTICITAVDKNFIFRLFTFNFILNYKIVRYLLDTHACVIYIYVHIWCFYHNRILFTFITKLITKYIFRKCNSLINKVVFITFQSIKRSIFHLNNSKNISKTITFVTYYIAILPF